MDDNWGPQLLYGIGALVLVISSLSVHKMEKGQVAKSILAWIIIFAVVFAAFSLLSGAGE